MRYINITVRYININMIFININKNIDMIFININVILILVSAHDGMSLIAIVLSCLVFMLCLLPFFTRHLSYSTFLDTITYHLISPYVRYISFCLPFSLSYIFSLFSLSPCTTYFYNNYFNFLSLLYFTLL